MSAALADCLQKHPATTAECITAIFGPLPGGESPWVCALHGDPKTAQGAAWAGQPATLPLAVSNQNAYFTLAVFRGPRRAANFARSFGLLLDDVTNPDALALAPSLLIETSPGNHQALYLFDTPQNDIDLLNRLQRAAIARGLSDPGADGPTARYGRLPLGVNGKHSPPFPVRLQEWHPERRYSIAQIVEGLGLVLDPVKPPRSATAAPDCQALSESKQHEIIADLRSALACMPADDRGQWISVGENLASMGDAGRELWIEWSRKSLRYNPGDEDQFDKFKGSRSDYRSIFTRALAAGWINPRRRGPASVFGDGPVLGVPVAAAAPVLLPPTVAPLCKAVRLVRGDAIALEPVRWLWPGFIPAGMLTIIGGSPGCGKTTIALSIAAIVTRGGTWPDGSRCTAAGDVLIWSGEDAQVVLAGRLAASGADLSRVHFIDGMTDDAESSFDPGRDMPLLEATAATLPAPRLLILDPVVSAVAGDGHKSNDVRRALQPVVTLGHRLGCAVIGITHFSKGTAGRDPTERITGSLAYAALARMVLVASKVQAAEAGGEPRRVFVKAKANDASDEGGFAYELERVTVAPEVEGQRVRWLEALEGTARDVLAEAEADGPAGDGDSASEVEAFVRASLLSGTVPANTFKRDTEGAGFQWRTVQRAAKKLGAESRKCGMGGGWRWGFYASPKATNSPEGVEGASPQRVTPLTPSTPGLSPSGGFAPEFEDGRPF